MLSSSINSGVSLLGLELCVYNQLQVSLGGPALLDTELNSHCLP